MHTHKCTHMHAHTRPAHTHMHTHTHMHMHTHTCTCTHTHTHTHTHTQSFMEWTEMDILLWMKAVEIDAYMEHFRDAGIRKGSDLKMIDLQMLQVCNITMYR